MLPVSQCAVVVLVFLLTSFSGLEAWIETITDRYGNCADNNSNIRFAPYHPPLEYHTVRASKGIRDIMLPFYRMARLIGQAGFSGYPYDAVVDLASLRIESALSNMDGGYKFGIVVGVIFIFVFFFLAITLPCCLYCASFCGRKSYTPLPSVWKVTGWGVVVLIVCATFVVTGMATTLETIDDSSEALAVLIQTVNHTMLNTKAYFDFFYDDLLFVFVKLNFTRKVIFRDLDHMGTAIHPSVGQALIKESGVGLVAEKIMAFKTFEQDILTLLRKMEQDSEALDDVMNTLNKDVKDLRTKCTSCPALNTPAYLKPSFSSAIDSLQELSKVDLKTEMEKGYGELDKIPAAADLSAKSQVQALKSNLDEQIKRISSFSNVVKEIKDKILQGLKLDVLDGLTKNYTAKMREADRVRTSTMKMLMIFILLAVLLLFVGATVLMLTFWTHVHYMERTGTEAEASCRTTTGQHFIYAGCVIFIIASWVWMMYSLFNFVLGPLLDKVICTAVNDPSFFIIDKLVDVFDLLGTHEEGTWLVQNVLPVKNSTASIGSLLRDCRDGLTFYQAIEMDKYPSANFLSIIEFFDNLNTTAVLKTIDFPIGKVNILTPVVLKYISGLESLRAIVPYGRLRKVSQLKIRAQVTTYYTNVPTQYRSAFAAKMKQRLDDFDKLQKSLVEGTKELDKMLSDFETGSPGVQAEVKQVQNQMGNFNKKAIAAGVVEFEKRMKRVASSFTKEATRNVLYEYGKCRPLFIIFQDLAVDAVCEGIITALNGSWLAVSWLHVFLLIAIYLAVHLNLLIPAPYTVVEPLPRPPPPPPLPPLPPEEPSVEPDEQSYDSDLEIDEPEDKTVVNEVALSISGDCDAGAIPDEDFLPNLDKSSAII